MRTLNTDLGKQLEASALGARMWRLKPGQASTKHRHFQQEELYLLVEGEGRVRIGEMSEEQLRHMYPDGPKALPPELRGD